MKSGVHYGLVLGLVLAVCGGALAVVTVREPPVEPADAPLLETMRAGPVERIETHMLDRGETLGALLSRAGLETDDLRNLLLTIREHLNPRRLRPSTEVTLRHWVDDGTIRRAEVRMNPDSTVRLDKRVVGWEGDVVVTPTAVDTVYASGVIADGSTLWVALVNDEEMAASTRYAVAEELLQIYAFQIDFFHDIRPGDAYRLAYEREVRPDGTVRSGRVLSAEIRNQGDHYPAIYFEGPNGDREYYDLEGESVRGAFRRYPVRGVRITSSFSWRRYHPVLGRYRAHLGTDFGAAYGTPVLATGDGVVRRAGPNGGYGNFIELRHPAGYTTRYAHLSRFADGIRRGRRVEQGDVIAYVGESGLATGPHLHYEFRRGGQPMNPRTADLPGGPPVPDSLRGEFRVVAEERTALLDRVPLPGPSLATVADEDRAEAPAQRGAL